MSHVACTDIKKIDGQILKLHQEGLVGKVFKAIIIVGTHCDGPHLVNVGVNINIRVFSAVKDLNVHAFLWNSKEPGIICCANTTVHVDCLLDNTLTKIDQPYTAQLCPLRSSGRGITHLEWRITRGYRLPLFTGGPDGSIRRWQPEGALDHGKVVANVGADIAHFAMGNGSSEHNLVIAQTDGTVSFWDGYGEI
ncbi:hypothetical protein FB446DRAFT_799772 [Lentinula raphanica]|nr:hypothetical protein FB446DRAFT_799772 [Lentinula raphanica]